MRVITALTDAQQPCALCGLLHGCKHRYDFKQMLFSAPASRQAGRSGSGATRPATSWLDDFAGRRRALLTPRTGCHRTQRTLHARCTHYGGLRTSCPRSMSANGKYFSPLALLMHLCTVRPITLEFQTHPLSPSPCVARASTVSFRSVVNY